MAFTFAAFCYIAALILTAVLIFFAIWHLIAFDELQHDYKNPVDQCNSLNPLVLPEYACHAVIIILMFCSGEITSAILNLPLTRIQNTRSHNIKVQSRNSISSILNQKAGIWKFEIFAVKKSVPGWARTTNLSINSRTR